MIIVEYHTTRSTTSLVPVIIVAHWSDSDSRFEKLRQWEWEGCWIPHNTLRHFISTCDCCTTLTARWQQGGLTEKSVEYTQLPMPLHQHSWLLCHIDHTVTSGWLDWDCEKTWIPQKSLCHLFISTCDCCATLIAQWYIRVAWLRRLLNTTQSPVPLHQYL